MRSSKNIKFIKKEVVLEIIKGNSPTKYNKYYIDEKKHTDPLVEVFKECQKYIKGLSDGELKWNESSPIKGHLVIPVLNKLLEKQSVYSEQKVIMYVDCNEQRKDKINKLLTKLVALLEGEKEVEIEIKEDPRDYIMGGKKLGLHIDLDGFIE